MADVLQSILTEFITSSPNLFPVKLEEDSYPVVGSSFSSTQFLLDYYEDPERQCVKGVRIKDVFEGGLNSLTSKQPSSRNAQLACQQLKDFFSRGCHSIVAKLKKEWKTEKEFNCMVATEVLIPLSSGYCLINRKTPDVRDKRLKLPIEAGVEGLVIGFSHGYYGELDMVVVQEYGSGTVLVSAPVEKQPRIDEGENSTSESEDGSPGKSLVEGKNTVNDSLSTVSQCIATIITFAQIQLERHPEVSYPIPMLRVDPEGVVVLVYDYPSDVLMISQRIRWNDFAFIVVWLTLHYSLFPPNTFSDLKDYCCGYSARSRGISLGNPWYLESPAVFSQSSRKKLIDYERICNIPL